MIEMDTTTLQSFKEMLDYVATHPKQPVIVKYGSADAKVAMNIRRVEIDPNIKSIVIIVEA